MELIEYFAKEWSVIGHAPATFLTAGTMLAGAAYAAASWRFGGIIESQRAQIDLLERKVSAQPGGADFTQRAAIVEGLANLMASGNGLVQRCEDSSQNLPTDDEFADWHNQAAAFLKEKLGSSYVVRFHNEAGGPMMMFISGRSSEINEQWNRLRFRMHRLDQFVGELT